MMDYTVTYSICSFILGVIFGICGSWIAAEIQGRKKNK